MIHYSIDSPEVTYLLEKDPLLKGVVSELGDLSYELYNDPFAFMVQRE